ncbi:hypothetical protein RJ639_001287 [Escallonia herrerae]|uniref:Uncharacterized protein n=1 Tax=Escallonia herrerae TaxID=1293975 RepID=A0AA89BMJ4_9ASTE|nr:hypothetical protein RJ639_001287 [Escallonia herrerae]
MKVHPVATKRNITARDAIDSTQPRNLMEGSAPKRLRRLPHVFSKVLELPFPSDADVSIEDGPECIRFVAAIGDDAVGGGVRARAVEIHDGVTKVVIRGGGGFAVGYIIEYEHRGFSETVQFAGECVAGEEIPRQLHNIAS